MADFTRTILEDLRRHEGFRDKPYRDSVGKLTIGYGWNLDAVPMQKSWAEFILLSQVEEAISDLRKFGFWGRLNDERKAVVANMRFQLGPTRFRGFEKMIAALERDDYKAAADEMLDSKAAKQTPNRYHELAGRMRSAGEPV